MIRFDDGLMLPPAYRRISAGPQLGGVFGDIWGGIKYVGGKAKDILTSGQVIAAAAAAAGAAFGIPPQVTAATFAAVASFRAKEGKPTAVHLEIGGQSFDFTEAQVEEIYKIQTGAVDGAIDLGIDPLWIVGGIASLGLLILAVRK